MDLTFVTTLVPWRGPAPFVFAPAPEGEADEIADVAARLTYGWGAIPATARLTALDGDEGTDSGGDAADAPPEDAGIAYTTSLFPREGTYFVPVKVAVQRAAGVGVGDRVRIDLHLELRR